MSRGEAQRGPSRASAPARTSKPAPAGTPGPHARPVGCEPGGRGRRSELVAVVGLWLAIGAAASCAHGPSAMHSPASLALAPDSATIGLWHMDEIGGYAVLDSGPYHLDGTAGQDTRTAFGRYGSARVFTPSIESFVYVPYSEVLESPADFTVEAWIYPYSITRYEDTPIAGRWTEQSGEQSWLFSLLGLNAQTPVAVQQSPGYHLGLIDLGPAGHLMFALQTEEAGPPQSYFSASEIELNQWSHVAATYDGEVVRFYINDRLDAQYALRGRIRTSRAPLLVGNYFDPHALTDFGGIFRVGTVLDRTPFYAYDGLIDELRLSNVARR